MNEVNNIPEGWVETTLGEVVTFQRGFDLPTTNRTTGNQGSGSGNLMATQVNPYDVRNNYYTYSKGNITFSGTGEQTREYIHYPDSE